jgi:hypothetical protein
MVTPTFADYVQLLFTLFERFMQQPAAHTHRGHPFVYLHQTLIVFFIIMQQRHIFRFKAQRRWLDQHPELRLPIGLVEDYPNTTPRCKLSACDLVSFPLAPAKSARL